MTSGENLCSSTSNWLRFATTTLVVALAEAGLAPGDFCELEQPLTALAAFAGDPSLAAVARLNDGRELGAIELQRHYLEVAETHAERPFMPPWTKEACRRWRDMLDRLAAGPGAVKGCLDWAIKYDFCSELLEKTGMTWDSVAAWTELLEELKQILAARNLTMLLRVLPAPNVPVDLLLRSKSPVRDELRRLVRKLEQRGCQWEGIRDFLDLRRTLFQVDLGYGRLGEEGIFNVLASRGELEHDLLGISDVDLAVSKPPRQGRARLRGEAVQRLAGESQHRCDWHGVFDEKGEVVLDLSDPLVLAES